MVTKTKDIVPGWKGAGQNPSTCDQTNRECLALIHCGQQKFLVLVLRFWKRQLNKTWARARELIRVRGSDAPAGITVCIASGQSSLRSHCRDGSEGRPRALCASRVAGRQAVSGRRDWIAFVFVRCASAAGLTLHTSRLAILCRRRRLCMLTGCYVRPSGQSSWVHDRCTVQIESSVLHVRVPQCQKRDASSGNLGCPWTGSRCVTHPM